MDDKGSTVIAVFGLPPLAHEDDAVRGVLSSLMICAQLFPLGLVPAIGTPVKSTAPVLSSFLLIHTLDCFRHHYGHCVLWCGWQSTTSRVHRVR